MNAFEIEKYLIDIEQQEMLFKSGTVQTKIVSTTNKSSSFFSKIIFINKCMLDFIVLHIHLSNKKYQSKEIVYTASNFCTIKNGKYEDRIVKPLFTNNILFINQSKEIFIDEINNQKVYNIGGLVAILRFFYLNKSLKMQIFYSYQLINDSIFIRFSKKNIYLLWFYDLNSLSISFSKYRHKLFLIEVQHGSIINYPPYAIPAPIKVIDAFYVKNSATIHYLKNNICKVYNCDYKIINNYSEQQKLKAEKLQILYASTIEFNGLHPVFIAFLEKINFNFAKIHIRLHPREKDKKDVFINQLSKFKIDYTFDSSENWLEVLNFDNLIVISPWSSTIEDAYDNQYTTIVIDPVGKKRFENLIDNKKCYYTNDIEQILSKAFRNNYENSSN